MTFFRDQLINQRVQEGASVRDVAQEFGMTTGGVVFVVCKAGGSFPDVEGRNKKIVERYREGASRAQIAQEMNIDINMVYVAIRRARRRRVAP